MKGTIKYYTPQKGFGFIKADGGPDYFFHIKEFPEKLVDEGNWPVKGERVEFETGVSERGNIAKRVRKT